MTGAFNGTQEPHRFGPPVHGVLACSLPPRNGRDRFGLEFARRFAHRLTLLALPPPGEPIREEASGGWMPWPTPGSQVVRLPRDLPSRPGKHPDFFGVWREAVRHALPEGFDVLFSAEAFGERLAQTLGAMHVPLPQGQDPLHHSGEATQPAPRAQPVKKKRVCLLGAESTGKTVLSEKLASHYGTVWVPEYARTFLTANRGGCKPEDIPFIARGQAPLEDTLVAGVERPPICDTDVLFVAIWSRLLFGRCESWIETLAKSRTYDLTLLMDTGVPWIDDGIRYFPEGSPRQALFRNCEAVLRDENRPFVLVSGNWEDREAAALRAVDGLLDAGRREGLPSPGSFSFCFFANRRVL